MKFITLPSQDELKDLLTYCEETGKFTWKVWPGTEPQTNIRNAKYAGKPAGTFNKRGYQSIKIRGIYLQAHRIAWAYVYGAVPAGYEIDHINGNGSDNRLANLRLATRAENAANRKLSTRNTTGVRGITLKDGCWVAHIGAQGEHRHLGVFDTKEEASAAYISAAEKLHGRFAAHLSREAA